MMRFIGRDVDDGLMCVFNVLLAYEEDNKAFLTVLAASDDAGNTESAVIHVFCPDPEKFLHDLAVQGCIDRIFTYEWVDDDNNNGGNGMQTVNSFNA